MFDIGCKLLLFCIFTLLNLLAYYSFKTVKPISLLVVRNFTRMNMCVYII